MLANKSIKTDELRPSMAERTTERDPWCMEHSVEKAEFYSHDFFTKIPWNQRHHWLNMMEIGFTKDFLKWEENFVFSTLCERSTYTAPPSEGEITKHFSSSI